MYIHIFIYICIYNYCVSYTRNLRGLSLLKFLVMLTNTIIIIATIMIYIAIYLYLELAVAVAIAG